MYGAILGDIIGAPFEFDRSKKTKVFPLFSDNSHFTDDTVMTIAVADALMKVPHDAPDETICDEIIDSMHRWGQKYPHAGYGGRFNTWLKTKSRKPYNSYGNGAAMRVASVGWLYDTIEETLKAARLTAAVTHDHPEGIKGAQATAAAIFLARNGMSKEEIKNHIIREFGYDLSLTCDEIRPAYRHVESCQETVPEAITAFLEGTDFEDVIRTAVSLGGDCDTLTCIAGSIAEAFYTVDDDLALECRKRLPGDMLFVLDSFMEKRAPITPAFHDAFLDDNETIEKAIAAYCADETEENLCAVLESIRTRMHQDGHFIIPAIGSEDGTRFALRTIHTDDNEDWPAAFTSQAEHKKGPPCQILSHFIDVMLKACMDMDSPGLIINPFGQSFMLTPELIDFILKADGDIEYHIPDDAITPELLEDGSFLKRAIEICNRNRINSNMIKLTKILRDSRVWIPCNAVLSEADYAEWAKTVSDAEKNDGFDSILGKELKNQDNIRMKPDILQNGDELFFPVFTSAIEMGEYGERFSKIETHFLEAADLAQKSEDNIAGIVINAFSEPFIVPRDLFDIIAQTPSAFEENKAENE
ncbi:MAG: ADP-ribosylglycohydrolase family protein [Clostridia bacterium]|nr:ADP-ribosylglycohydrolase family protein [Clostridia bacterium]